MDDELLKRYHLEGVQKRLQQINEYTFVGGSGPVLGEDDDDDMNNQNQQMPPQQMPPQGGNQQMPPQQQPPMGGGDIMGGQGQQPPMDGGIMGGGQQGGPGQQPPMDGGMQPPMDGNMGGMPDQGMGGDMPGGDMPMPDDGQGGEQPPMGGDEMMDMPMGDEGEMEDEEVIDVDDLTQSQEAAEYKIDGVDEKLTTLLNVIDKFSAAIENNDKQIADLRREFEKRNPTPEERLNIRSQSSYPYEQTPKDYWEKKRGENSNYNVIFDNNVAPEDEDKEFEIRKSDLENIDSKTLSDTFDYPKELRDYISF